MQLKGITKAAATIGYHSIMIKLVVLDCVAVTGGRFLDGGLPFFIRHEFTQDSIRQGVIRYEL